MIAASDQNGVTRLHDAYLACDRALRLRQAKVGYVLSLLLVPAGVTLDRYVYPGLTWPLFKARLCCDLALLPFFLLAFTHVGTRFIYLIDKPCALIPTLSICWMVYMTEGVFSPYYAGLNLIMVAVCLIMPYTLKEGATFCGFVIFFYAAACVMLRVGVPGAHSSSASSASTLFNNLYFITLTTVVCATACHILSIRRFEDFRLRYELDANNRELASTLAKLKETEVQLVQSEKMNALGKLSAGLLHEINNPLNFTFMALQVANQEAGDNVSLKDTLTDIEQGMGRIKSVISDLRGFAYPSKLQHPEPFAVEEALVSAMRLVAHELGDIAVDRPEPPPEKVFGVKSQIVHVFMNLIMNSAQAMKSKSLGRKPQIAITWQIVDERLKIAVRDNGTGVAPANLPRLFEPFFTTKDVGQGTGLGLSICHTIVKNHGGGIAVASQEGQWTQVTFDLPLATAGSFV